MAHAVAVTRQRMASGAEPLTEALTRDGTRSSRHASEAPGYPIENMGRYPHSMGMYPHVIDGDSSPVTGRWLHLYKPSLTTRIQIWVHQRLLCAKARVLPLPTIRMVP